MIKLIPNSHIINQINIPKLSITIELDDYPAISAGIKSLGGEIFNEKRAGSLCKVFVDFGGFINGAEKLPENVEKVRQISEFIENQEYKLL